MKFICALILSAILILGCSAVEIRYPNSTDPCIMINMEANLTLLFTATDGTKEKTSSVLEQGDNSTGTCATSGGGSSQLDFYIASGVKGTVNFLFTKATDSSVKLDMGLTFKPNDIFKNEDNDLVTMTDKGSIQMGPDTKSYTCSGQRNITFDVFNGTKGQYELSVEVSSMQMQGFNVVGNSFSDAIDCSAIDKSTVSPSSEGPTTEPAVSTEIATTSSPSNDTTTVAPSNDTTSEAQTTEPSKQTTQPAEPTTTPASTTAIPTPAPGSPDDNRYMAKDVNGSTCILLDAGIEFVVPYVATSGNKSLTLGIDALNKNETSFTGNCSASNVTQTLTVTFYKTSTLAMTFTKDGENSYLSNLDLSIDLTNELFPDAKTPGKVSATQTFKDQFKAAIDGSYKCNDNSQLTLNNGFKMNTYHFQYAAFQSNLTDFKTSGITECPADDKTNSVVPIAVGAALAGLVIIVLIAYLIGRKRSRQSGYEQV